jgi:hypothetical protein
MFLVCGLELSVCELRVLARGVANLEASLEYRLGRLEHDSQTLDV